MLTTTLADLVVHAQKAANTAHAAATVLEQQTAKIQAFTDSGFHAADFQTWESAFQSQIQMLEAFTKQPSPAAAAAAKVAQTQSAPGTAPAS